MVTIVATGVNQKSPKLAIDNKPRASIKLSPVGLDKDLTNKDPKEVVIDEFIGQSIPICLYEIAHSESTDPAKVLTFYFIMFILYEN